MTSLVSIIIPAFNYERYVARAIESALGQDYGSIEIVVVNDGSSDGTAGVAQSFADRGVRCISQSNQGLAAARNTGIANSSGDLLFFLDADDFLLPGAITWLVKEIGSLDDSWGIVASQAKVMHADGSVMEPDSGEPAARGVSWAELVFGSRFPCTVLARRKVFEKCGGFDAEYHRLGCEDRDMWLRVAEHFRIWMVPQRLVVVSFHGANMSSDPGRQLAGMRRCLDKAFASSMSSAWRLDFRLRAWAAYHCTANLLHSEAGQPLRAAGHALASLIIWPVPGLSRQIGRCAWFRPRRLLIGLRDATRRCVGATSKT